VELDNRVTQGNFEGGSWIPTHTGKLFSILTPTAEMVDIRDIAYGLSYQFRYSGQANPAVTVTEHSLLLSYAVPPEKAWAAMLHDAAEFILGDMPGPLKRALIGDKKAGLPSYKDVENHLLELICSKYGLSLAEVEDPELKWLDKAMLINEFRDCFPDPARARGIEIWQSRGYRPIPNVSIKGWDSQMAYRLFMERVKELRPEYYLKDDA